MRVCQCEQSKKQPNCLVLLLFTFREREIGACTRQATYLLVTKPCRIAKIVNLFEVAMQCNRVHRDRVRRRLERVRTIACTTQAGPLA